MGHYKNHSITIQDTADSSAVVIGSLTQVSTPIDHEVIKDETGGKAYPDQISIVSQKPRVAFTSFDLPKIITAFGLNGRLLTAASPKLGFALHQAFYNDGGVIASGSNHRRLTLPKSFSRVNRISVSHRQNATAECEAVAIYDGTNDPIVIEGTVAVPTLPASAGRWTLSDMEVDDISIGCKTQLDIDFGFNVDAYGCDDEIWDSHLDVTQIHPMITITSLDPTNFADAKVLLEGLVGAHADSKLILRKRTSKQASYVADATEEHISITFSGVILATDAHNASGNSKASSTFRIEVDYDGTNAPFVFDTTAAATI
jgi:hypothetical protein